MLKKKTNRVYIFFPNDLFRGSGKSLLIVTKHGKTGWHVIYSMSLFITIDKWKSNTTNLNSCNTNSKSGHLFDK
jgi:hypothetical protein